MKTITETLTFKRETKGAVLYENLDQHPKVAVTSIYLRKNGLGDVYPNEIRITIEAVE